MVELKVVVSDPKTGRAYNVDASTGAAGAIVGKRIGDEVDAGPLGLAGYKILITGGSDQTALLRGRACRAREGGNFCSRKVSASTREWMASAGER